MILLLWITTVACAEDNLLALAQADIDARGAEVVRKDRTATGGARGLLWLARAQDFVAQFMAELGAPDKSQVSTYAYTYTRTYVYACTHNNRDGKQMHDD